MSDTQFTNESLTNTAKCLQPEGIECNKNKIVGEINQENENVEIAIECIDSCKNNEKNLFNKVMDPPITMDNTSKEINNCIEDGNNIINGYKEIVKSDNNHEPEPSDNIENKNSAILNGDIFAPQTDIVQNNLISNKENGHLENNNKSSDIENIKLKNTDKSTLQNGELLPTIPPTSQDEVDFDDKSIKNIIPESKPIKISMSPLIHNNTISHELKETDIFDGNSIDPLDCDSTKYNFNGFSNQAIEQCEEKEFEPSKDLMVKLENELGLQVKKENGTIESCKSPKDDNDTGEKRVPLKNIVDTDSDEESVESAEEDNVNNEDEETGYNTEIQDVLLQVPKSPLSNHNNNRRSNLKRKLEDNDSYNGRSKRRKNIQFDGTTVFYFQRFQGFNCVPSQGGSTLGMSRKHFCIKRFSLTEHAAEQKRMHKEQLLQSRLQKKIIIKRGNCSSSEDSDTSDISDSELETESFFFLQPLQIRQRRSLLKQAGIRQIEVLEKEECKDIRVSREMCGCQCKVSCLPESCQCAEAGIKCQVDRHNFPCGCTREGCGNNSGRIEFNPIRVRTHFLQTLMRLEIEKRQTQWENNDRKKATSPWFLNGGTAGSINAAGYFQSLNSSQALSNDISCLPMPDTSNLRVPLDINQHENKNTAQNYTGAVGDYNSNGCYMFCENVTSPFDSVPTFPQTYCSNLPNLSSQNNFCHSCDSYSLSKLSSCSSPFSSFPCSNAFAATVAVVSPGANNHISVQNGLSFPPTSAIAFSKMATKASCAGSSAHDQSCNNSGLMNKHPPMASSTDIEGSKRDAETYSRMCSLSQYSTDCASSGSELSCNISPSSINQHYFPDYKPAITYFNEPSTFNSSFATNTMHQPYFNTNSCFELSINRPSNRFHSFNNHHHQLTSEFKHSFVSDNRGDKFGEGFSTCSNATSSIPSSSSATTIPVSGEGSTKGIIPKVEDLITPIVSNFKEETSSIQSNGISGHDTSSQSNNLCLEQYTENSEFNHRNNIIENSSLQEKPQ